MRNRYSGVVGRALLAVLLLLGSGCSLVQRENTMSPYKENPSAAAQLELEAEEYCRSIGRSLPPRSFRTDGCSGFLDGNWGACCRKHDIQYWCGGSIWDRVVADYELSVCVAETAPWGPNILLPALMPLVIRFTGSEFVPAPWHWDYGTPTWFECLFEEEAGCR